MTCRVKYYDELAGNFTTGSLKIVFEMTNILKTRAGILASRKF